MFTVVQVFAFENFQYICQYAFKFAAIIGYWYTQKFLVKDTIFTDLLTILGVVIHNGNNSRGYLCLMAFYERKKYV